MMLAPFPAPGAEMMAARAAAFDPAIGPRGFDRELFQSLALPVAANDLRGGRRSSLVDRIVGHLARGPEGSGTGYCLLRGFRSFSSVQETRATSAALLRDVWGCFRSRSPRIPASRDFFTTETLTHDGAIPPELFGSRWSFKVPHADRNGVLFAHVYGPTAGFEGGAILVVDALAYAASLGLGFEDVCGWSADVGDKKPVLRPEHVRPALAGFGRSLGVLGTDEVLFINNSPEGVLHGASELLVRSETSFVRVLHRCVVRERDQVEVLGR